MAEGSGDGHIPGMPNYRRARVPGGCFFFTQVTDRRANLFQDATARSLLASSLRRWRTRWPFGLTAIVLLPDHLHAIWTLPPGDGGFSTRWAWLKKEFTKAWLAIAGSEQPVSRGRQAERRRGVWQPRFWEHTIQDEEDFEQHFDYIHYNPVKHGLVRTPCEWPWPSFHRWVRRGVYPPDWACGINPPPDFASIDHKVGE
jgi:putative transposase